jgi:hypothetical protein
MVERKQFPFSRRAAPPVGSRVPRASSGLTDGARITRERRVAGYVRVRRPLHEGHVGRLERVRQHALDSAWRLSEAEARRASVRRSARRSLLAPSHAGHIDLASGGEGWDAAAWGARRTSGSRPGSSMHWPALFAPWQAATFPGRRWRRDLAIGTHTRFPAAVDTNAVAERAAGQRKPPDPRSPFASGREIGRLRGSWWIPPFGSV